jgi:hypothetical protein
MRATAVLALLLAGPAVAQTYDVPWFKTHPEERRALLRRCHADVALAHTRECQNSELAGASELGRRLPPASAMPRDPWERFLAPQGPPAPRHNEVPTRSTRAN